jgi:hypothetical protein
MFHKELTPEQWFKFSTYEQLANVGCDIGRTIRWKAKGDMQHSEAAFLRALELLSLTIIDPKNSGPELRELCLARELLIDHFMFENTYNTTAEGWDQYFFDFNYAAALEREKRHAERKTLS